MTAYVAPIRDMTFVIKELAGLDQVASLPNYQELGVTDVADAILEEAGKFSSEVLAPLNWQASEEGARLENGQVRAPTGFADVYRQFSEGGVEHRQPQHH